MNDNVRADNKGATAFKTFILVIVVALLSLVLLEGGMRVIFGWKMGDSALFYGTDLGRDKPLARTIKDHTNTEAGYTKYHPNEKKVDYDPLAKEPESFDVTINRWGFRGDDYEIQKAPGTIRIVTLGASSTFGYYNRDHDTYPSQLEARLNKLAAEEARFEVINLGIPHLKAAEIRALFEAEALPLDPDVVTFYEGFNDSVRPWGEAGKQGIFFGNAEGQTDPLMRAYGFARDHFLAVAFVDQILGTGSLITYTINDFQQHREGKREGFVEKVAAINSAVKARDAIFIVVKQQAKSVYQVPERVAGITYEQEFEIVRKKLWDTDSINFHEIAFLTHKKITDELEKWARINNVPMVDAIELLDNDRHVLLSVVHLSPEGNRMIAYALADEINRQLASKNRK